MPMLNMTNARLCLIAALGCIATPADAQSPESMDLTTVGKDPRWKLAGRTTSIVDIKGKRALKLSEGTGMGVVWLDGYDFANGVIEVDILGRSQPVSRELRRRRAPRGGCADARRRVLQAIQLSRG